MTPCVTTVLFGAGSSILVDVEETCRRLQIEVVAIINNCDGQSHTLQPEKMLKLSDMSPALLDHPLTFPMFTPGYRKFARDQAIALGAKLFTPLIDPTAVLASSIEISEGVYVNSGAVIGGKTSLGAFSFINRSVSLGHHTSVAEFASVGPGAVTGGHVSIGKGAVLGVGAVVLPGLSIGANSVVGAGSVVTRDVAHNTVVMGNPARCIRGNVTGYNGVGI